MSLLDTELYEKYDSPLPLAALWTFDSIWIDYNWRTRGLRRWSSSRFSMSNIYVI